MVVGTLSSEDKEIESLLCFISILQGDWVKEARIEWQKDQVIGWRKQGSNGRRTRRYDISFSNSNMSLVH